MVGTFDGEDISFFEGVIVLAGNFDGKEVNFFEGLILLVGAVVAASAKIL